MAAAMPLLCPMLPTTSKITAFNEFSEDIWRKIVDMDIVDNMSLVVMKEKKVKSNTKKSNTKKAKSGKKRKADTKSETEPTTKRRSSRRRSS